MRQVEKELMILIEELLKEQYNFDWTINEIKLFVVIVATAESQSLN